MNNGLHLRFTQILFSVQQSDRFFQADISPDKYIRMMDAKQRKDAGTPNPNPLETVANTSSENIPLNSSMRLGWSANS
ncbi:MAG: hypothetical protein VXY74_17130 [SAR324 cluster bacterium]|nr:hypothetical protein [SAR324 cluster bacterium]